MILVLCSAVDLSALWLYRGLQARGMSELELVSAELLASALRWEHRIANDAVLTTITLADDRTIRSTDVRGVLNRLTWPGDGRPVEQLSGDRAYAAQEVAAFYLSWLHALPGPILNPPTPQGLCGRFRDDAEWRSLAWAAGLPVRTVARRAHGDAADADHRAPAPLAPTRPPRTVVVVGDAVTGADVPEPIASACVDLARMAGTPLLGIDFDATDGEGSTFAGATPIPDLTLGGTALIERVAEALAA